MSDSYKTHPVSQDVHMSQLGKLTIRRALSELSNG